jgi:hypothetical protein
MKNFIFYLAVAFVFGIRCSYAQERSAEIKKVWLEHNVSQNGENGMEIHSVINVNGMKGKQIQGIAYFYKADKSMLKGNDSGYIATDGQVSSSAYGTSNYDNSVFNDFCIFIPYNAIPMSYGKHDYYCCVRVYDTERKEFISPLSDYVSFVGTSRTNKFNLPIIKGVEYYHLTDKTDYYAGKQLKLVANTHEDSTVYMTIEVETEPNTYSNIYINSSKKKNDNLLFDDEVVDAEIIEKYKEIFKDAGQLIRYYAVSSYSPLDKRKSLMEIGFHKNGENYVLSVCKVTSEYTKDKMKTLFTTMLTAKIDDYSAISEFIETNINKTATRPYDCISNKGQFEMASYANVDINHSTSLVKIKSFAVMDVLGKSFYSFFLELYDGALGKGSVSELAESIKSISNNGQVSDNVFLLLDDGSKIVLGFHNVEAVDNNTVSFNMNMEEENFNKLKQSNITALATSGSVLIFESEFRSAATLNFMEQNFPTLKFDIE